MKLLIVEESDIIKNKAKVERALNIKIEIKDKEITINGSPEDEYVAEKVIDALSFGFPFSVAISIKDEDMLFERINIKDYTKRKDMETIKARIIGKGGKTLRTLSQLTECRFELKAKDNDVGIIGSAECIKNAQDAIISIIQGSKQANVYSFLEKHQVKPVIDLGLKEKPKKKTKKK